MVGLLFQSPPHASVLHDSLTFVAELYYDLIGNFLGSNITHH